MPFIAIHYTVVYLYMYVVLVYSILYVHMYIAFMYNICTHACCMPCRYVHVWYIHYVQCRNVYAIHCARHVWQWC